MGSSRRPSRISGSKKKNEHLCPGLVGIFIKKKVYRALETLQDAEYVESSSLSWGIFLRRFPMSRRFIDLRRESSTPLSPGMREAMA